MSHPPRSNRIAKFGAVFLAAAGMLAACGGFDDDGDSTAQTVPGSAFATSASFIDYLKTLALNDTGEPLTFDGFTAPVDDTGEPTPLT
ncbi:MAG: hypothetical protein ABIO45_14225 [Burkholderiaceae bacterium]